MAGFVCDWCGKCCRSFGEFIRIERQLSEQDYYCRYGLTNELFMVHVQPEFAEDISGTFSDDRPEREPQEKKCPFSRKNPDGKGFICAVYPTRPPVCRDFRCYRMLIHNRKGALAGKMVSQNELITDDEELAAIWKEQVKPLSPSLRGQVLDPVWIKNVLVILARHGYRGDPVE